jgi:hypothetical protein
MDLKFCEKVNFDRLAGGLPIPIVPIPLTAVSKANLQYQEEEIGVTLETLTLTRNFFFYKKTSQY